jgi:hypothetical protein
LTFDSPDALPPARERGPPALLVVVEWRAGLGMVERARRRTGPKVAALPLKERWPARL